MAAISAGRDACPVAGNAVYYAQRLPEQSLLYPIVEEYYPAFLDLMAAQGRPLPVYVQREFDDYLRCGRLGAERTVRLAVSVCESAGGDGAGAGYRLPGDRHASHQESRADPHDGTDRCRDIDPAIRQRAESQHPFPHVVPGGRVRHWRGCPVFSARQAADSGGVGWAHIGARVGRYLERQGLLVRDVETSYLALEVGDDAALDDLLSHSITYRIALGPHQGQKAFTLQTIPAETGDCEER